MIFPGENSPFQILWTYFIIFLSLSIPRNTGIAHVWTRPRSPALASPSGSYLIQLHTEQSPFQFLHNNSTFTYSQIHLLPSSSHLPGISKNASSPLPLPGCLCDLTGLPYYSIPKAFDHNMLRFLVFWAHILTIWELLLSTCGNLTRMHNSLFSWVSPCPDTVGGEGDTIKPDEISPPKKSQFQLLLSTEASPNHLLQLHIATCNQIHWIFLLLQRCGGGIDFDYVQTSPSCGFWDSCPLPTWR